MRIENYETYSVIREGNEKVTMFAGAGTPTAYAHITGKVLFLKYSIKIESPEGFPIPGFIQAALKAFAADYRHFYEVTVVDRSVIDRLTIGI